jgi:hypothetical protein
MGTGSSEVSGSSAVGGSEGGAVVVVVDNEEEARGALVGRGAEEVGGCETGRAWRCEGPTVAGSCGGDERLEAGGPGVAGTFLAD